MLGQQGMSAMISRQTPLPMEGTDRVTLFPLTCGGELLIWSLILRTTAG